VTTILLADDHQILLRPLKQLIESESDMTVVSIVSTGQAALAALQAHQPDLALLDLAMPSPGGMELLRILNAERSPVRVVFMTASISNEHVVEAIAAGVAGILLKESAAEDMLTCLHTVAQGEKWLPLSVITPALAGEMARGRRNGDALTPREKEIATCVARGLSNKHVARQLNISEGTVKMHLHNIYGKIGVSNRTELAYARLLD
jgi:two-component system nitrate/nitrite response regulator NarL